MTDERPERYYRLTGDEPDADGYGAILGPRDDHPSFDLAEGVTFQPIYGRNLTLNFVTFGPGTGFPRHQHPEEQAGLIVEGEMELTIGDRTRVLRAGDVYLVPPNMHHEGRTLEVACTVLDIFAPPRAGMPELIERTMAYPRRIEWWELGSVPAPEEGPRP